MAFCVTCGNEVREAAAFCGKCGAAAATPVRAADETIARADRIVAEETLKKEHGKLVGMWAAAGTMLTFLINIILMVIGFSIGGVVGGSLSGHYRNCSGGDFRREPYSVAIRAVQCSQQESNRSVTGKPMRMLWFSGG